MAWYKFTAPSKAQILQQVYPKHIKFRRKQTSSYLSQNNTQLQEKLSTVYIALLTHYVQMTLLVTFI